MEVAWQLKQWVIFSPDKVIMIIDEQVNSDPYKQDDS